jgi:hypothetical protein
VAFQAVKPLPFESTYFPRLVKLVLLLGIVAASDRVPSLKVEADTEVP